MITKNIYDYIQSEESAYQTVQIPITDNWEWNMWEHIKRSILYKNSKYEKGDNDGNRPNKNITLPILRLQYRSEGFDVKDILLYVNEAKKFYKSFLISKYHDKWARDNDIDTFIDEMVESYVDFGGALVKNVNQIRPEVVPLQRLAFCDQTDILSGPICEKHFYSPSQLKQMGKKHGWKNIDEVITMAEYYKENSNTSGKQSKTPGKYVEVYELHGCLPKWWLGGEYDSSGEDYEFEDQIHICAFYQDEKRQKNGITLFSGKEKESVYKLILRDEIYGRALGLGGAEELFEPQVWTNYDQIRIKDMLDAASKIILQTSDSSLAQRNDIKSLDNLSIIEYEDGKPLSQVDNFPRNLALFERSTQEWEKHAQTVGSAQDSIMGETAPSGTPFKLQQLISLEAHSIHDYRKGKLATFLSEVYRDWLIPQFTKKISQGVDFMSELELEELQSISQTVIDNQTDKILIQKTLNGETWTDQEKEVIKQNIQSSFMKGGRKKFIEIFKDEFKDTPIDVEINIAGKQKNLAGMVDKLTNVFRTVLQTPQVLQDPTMARLFNQIMEASGLNPIDFSSMKPPQSNQLLVNDLQKKPMGPPVETASQGQPQM